MIWVKSFYFNMSYLIVNFEWDRFRNKKVTAFLKKRAAISKMGAIFVTGRIWDGPIAKNHHWDIVYLWTKLYAFLTNLTIISPICSTISQFSSWWNEKLVFIWPPLPFRCCADNYSYSNSCICCVSLCSVL